MRHLLLFSVCVGILGCQPRSTVPETTRGPQNGVSIKIPPSSADSIPTGVESDSLIKGFTRVVDTAAMIEVPAGIAVLGSTEEDIEWALKLCKSDAMSTKDTCTVTYNHEMPRHEVYIDRFWIDTDEVTVAQYDTCVEDGQCIEPNESAKFFCNENTYLRGLSEHPINCVDWQQAIAYCRYVGKRLPSAEEWEKAARGPMGLTFPWGEAPPTCEHAYGHRGGCESWVTLNGPTAPVGSMPIDRSPYGAMDMAGNVSEWTATQQEEGYRIIKGGSAVSTPAGLRGAHSMAGAEEEADDITGFRCAYSEEDVTPEEAPAPGL